MEHYGLKRIILIDSYLPGRRYIVETTGHTNITGENGVGKTSLIKLPVIFYGERPLHLDIKANPDLNYSGFTGRYLPHDGSYIVFEYLANGENKLLVLYPDKRNQEGVVRLFADASYEDSLFFNAETETPLTTEAFRQHLVQRNIRTFSAHSFEKHRAVLLDGSVHGQAHFAMVPQGTKMSRLHQLFSGMLQRGASFDVLCNIIEGWAQDGIATDAKNNLNNFKLDRHKLQGWLIDYRAHAQIKKAAQGPNNDIDKLSECWIEFKHHNARMALALDKARGLKVTLNRQLESTQTDYTQQSRELEQAQKLLIDMRQKKQTDVSALEQRISTLQSEMHNLSARKEIFQNELGTDHQAKLTSMAQLNSVLDQSQSSLAVLTKDIHNIESWFEKEKSEIKLGYIQQISQQKMARSSLINEQKGLLFETKDKHQTQLALIKDQYRAQLEQLQNKAYELQKNLDDVTREIDNPMLEQEMSAHRDKTREAVKNQKDALLQLNETDRHKRDRIQQAQGKVSDLIDEYRHIEEDIDLLHEQLTEINQALDIKPNALISFLKVNALNWEETFGKVLKKDILYNENLAPLVVDANSQTVFGVELDITGVAQLDRLDEQTLLAKRETLLSEIDALEASLKRKEREIGRANKAKKIADDQGLECEIKITRVRHSINTAEQQLTEVEAGVAAWFKEYRQVRANTRVQLKQAKALTEGETDELKRQHNATLEDEQNRFNKADQARQATDLPAVQALEKHLEQLPKRQDEALNNLNITRSQKMHKAHVDPIAVQALEARIHSHQTQIKALEKLQSLYETYQAFLSEDFPKLALLNKDKDGLSAQLTHLFTSLAEYKESVFASQNQRNVLDTRFHELKHRLEGQLSQLENTLMNQMDDRPTNLDEEDILLPDDPLQLCKEYKQANHDRRVCASTLKERTTRLKTIFEQHQGSQLNNYWSNNPANSENLHSIAERIINYVRQGHMENDERTLCNNLSELDKLNSYCDYISSFSRKINAFNRHLDEHVAQATDFEGLDSLTTTIYFSLTETETWKDMKALSDAHRRWLDASHSTSVIGHMSEPKLPNQEFFTQLENYVEYCQDETLSIQRLADHIDFRLTLTDKGAVRRIKSRKNLASASSNALSYLVLVVLFVGFVNMVRRKAPVSLVWALDELNDISKGNIEKLLSMLKANNMHIISACPDVDQQVYDLFDHTYELFRGSDGVAQLRQTDNDPGNFAGSFSDPLEHELLAEEKIS